MLQTTECTPISIMVLSAASGLTGVSVPILQMRTPWLSLHHPLASSFFMGLLGFSFFFFFLVFSFQKEINF